MSILSDLTSGDAQRIWEGACAVRHLRNAEELQELVRHLEEIKRTTAGIPLGGMIRLNSTHLTFALHKLRFVRDSTECLCALYAFDDFYDPGREVEAGAVKMLERVLKDGFVDYYHCECSVCGNLFRVEEREYHHTWWRWQKV